MKSRLAPMLLILLAIAFVSCAPSPPERTAREQETAASASPAAADTDTIGSRATLWVAAVVAVVGAVLTLWLARTFVGRRTERGPSREAPRWEPDVAVSRVVEPAQSESRLLVGLSNETLRALEDILGPGRSQDPAIENLNKALASIQQQLQEQAGFVHAWKDQQRVLAQDIRRLNQRDLVSYFEDWKQANLNAAQHHDATRTLQAFRADEAANRDLAQARELLDRTLARARLWFDSLGAWSPAASVPGAPSSPDGLLEAITTYCARGRKLVQQLDEWLAKCDLDTVPSDPGLDISFFDVVAGRSADQVAAGYRARLERRRADVVTNAKELALEWLRLRDALPGLLDAYYALAAQFVSVGGGQFEDTGLIRALAAAQIQEIAVVAGRTAFDATIHDAVPGSRQLRPELAENTVLHVERRGFFHEGKVIRKALVSLSSRAT